MEVNDRDAAAARYIDAKADACRRRKEESFDVAARVLDALADEIRMGLHSDDPTDGSEATGQGAPRGEDGLHSDDQGADA